MGYFSHQLDDPAAAKPAICWEETACPLCEGSRSQLVIEAPDWRPGGDGFWFAVVRCASCGLSYTNPRPDAASIGRFYPHDYTPHFKAGKPLRRSGLAALFAPFRGDFRKYLHRQGRGRLLDFGCGGGAFLERMHQFGWQVTGVDAAPAAIDRVRSRPGLRALTGSLPHPDLADGSYDVITMWESLEHVHNPLQVLRAAHRLLAPHGKLIVAVPNIDSLAFRWFGSAWYGLDLPRHLTHFAPWTLQMMLNRAGFRTGPTRMLRHSSWLWRSAQRSQHVEPNRRSRLLAKRFPARVAAWYTRLLRRGDCILTVARKTHADW